MEAHSLIQILFPILVISVMFGLGLSLNTDDFRRVMIKPKAVIIALTLQLVFLPATAFFLVKLFSLEPELAVGFIIIAAAPGGIISNVLTLLLKGDTALSITLTTLSSLIAIVSIPFWVSLALDQFMGGTDSVSFSAVQLVLPVAVLTLIPIGLGLFIRSRWPVFADTAKSKMRVGSSVFILVGIAVFLIDQRQHILPYLVQAGLVAAMLCLLTTLFGYSVARLFKLSRSTQATIAVETGIQNIPLAMTIAITHLGHNSLFAIAPATYGVVMVIVMTVVLAGIIARWPGFQFSSRETK
ncbi:MAG: bile acid:sodium symporter family protein [Gammaproteobacteria bacterium]|nr:bile acid:sodium symporter family protein [Gammaproteobacteria bacterium]